MSEGRAEAQLAQLVDIEALKHLKARYCHLVDARAWDELATLWTEDAVCDYGFFGCYQGRQAIMDGFFRGAVDSVCAFMVHLVHNPLIEVTGDTATAKW